MYLKLINMMQIDLIGILGKILIPFMVVFGVSGVVLQQTQTYLTAPQFFYFIEIWFFSFGAGLIIIMNMVSYVLGRSKRQSWIYWPAQIFLTFIIFLSMFWIILVVSGVVRWHAIKLLSGLVGS